MLSRESKMYALKYLKLPIPTKLICHFHNTENEIYINVLSIWRTPSIDKINEIRTLFNLLTHIVIRMFYEPGKHCRWT